LSGVAVAENMRGGIPTAGLSLGQAPPLSIPTSFFLTIPLALLAAGLLLMATGIAPFQHPRHPSELALTHIGTIGVLLAGMMGALYQMTPVVAGAPVPAIRVAHAVHILMLIGLAGFVWRLLGGPVHAMNLAAIGLALGTFGFLLPVGLGLFNSATHNETTLGMRLALVSLGAIAAIGLLMSRGYAGERFLQDRFLWIQVHLTIALLGLAGGLIVSVSRQVLPMFYLARPWGRRTMHVTLAALLTVLLFPFAAFMANSGDGVFSASQWAAVASFPAALAIWIVHPFATLKSIALRKRRRRDASLLFWQSGLVMAFPLVPLAGAACFSDDHRWATLFGWFAIWGWAGMIMHGMLTRIVPFLVWFHRVMPWIGRKRVPSMRSLLPDTWMRIGFSIHAASIIVGTAAIVTQVSVVARLTGILVALTAISLASSMIHALRKGWNPD
jgi:hypothetical protein